MSNKEKLMKIFALDNNECNNAVHGCQQKCVNDHGNFSCACLSGYQLNSDQKTCSGKTKFTSLLNVL